MSMRGTRGAELEMRRMAVKGSGCSRERARKQASGANSCRALSILFRSETKRSSSLFPLSAQRDRRVRPVSVTPLSARRMRRNGVAMWHTLSLQLKNRHGMNGAGRKKRRRTMLGERNSTGRESQFPRMCCGCQAESTRKRKKLYCARGFLAGRLRRKATRPAKRPPTMTMLSQTSPEARTR